MIKRFFIVLFACISIVRSYACGGYYEPDYEYYNLFMQELVDDPAYFPFLLTYNTRYYGSNQEPIKNGNIEEWEHYLGLSYEQTFYLVFKASMEDIDALIEGQKVADKKLNFVEPAFVRKHKAALQYLVYAKYLEPYMRISQSDDSWSYQEINIPYTADQLDYETVIKELKQHWQESKDKELKLRYGYQLVRFAHYNRNYEESVSFFDQYVESLKYRPAMYYYALSQRAGAERGLGNGLSSRWNFFHVFVHSQDLKSSALSSITFDNDVDFNTFFEHARTQEERNNIYLLLGLYSYNNPLNEIEKIVEVSPDAVQAKVLIARAINQIEREVMPIYFWGGPDMNSGTIDKRYPLADDIKIKDFLEQTLNLVDSITDLTTVTDRNFWFITSAYLHFLKKDFVVAKQMLDRIETNHILYVQQKQNLTMYIDICKQLQITPTVEMELLEKYPDIFKVSLPIDIFSNTGSHAEYSTKAFVLDVLANRYYLQKDYAKSFLLSNKLSVLENNPQLVLLNAIKTFYHQPNKNEWEEYLLSSALAGLDDAEDYMNYLYGIIYLTNGDLEKASESFAGTLYNSAFVLPSDIFGYNRIECFECANTMDVDYLADFDFIPAFMNFKELTNVLVSLEKTAQLKNKMAAKANYLLGNFFYNVSEGGYFRHVLHFGTDNGYYSGRYGYYKKPDLENQIYFKYYGNYYEDSNPIAWKYLEKAYQQTSDNELKARIVFALSKCEQLDYNISSGNMHYWWYYDKGNGILISDRKYFKELMRYKDTKFFDIVQSNCKYFDYYVTHCVN